MERSALDKNEGYGEIAIPALLFVLTLLIYYKHLCPSLWWMDSGEFIFHSTVLGIPHPTGYPLYIQLGKLLTLLPWLDGVFAINFFSALMASFTVVLLYRIILVLGGEVFSASIASLIFAFSFTFWSQAEIAEVYTLHAFFLSLMILLLLKLRNTEDRRIFLLLSFILGLSFTHHMSTVLIIPAILFFVLIFRRKEILCRRVLVPSLVLFLVGLSVYLFIPMRAHLPPPFNYPMLHDVDAGELLGLFWLVTGRIVKADMFQYPLAELDKPVTFYFVKLMRDFLYVGFILGILGALTQFHRERYTFYTFFLVFFAYFVFFVNYGVVDQHVFFIPSFLIWAIWFGIGLSFIADKVRSVSLSGMRNTILRFCFIYGSIGLVAIALLRGFEELDFSTKSGPGEFAWDILNHVEENALLVSIYEATPLLWYYHHVKGLNPGVEIFDRGLMSLNVRSEAMETLDSRSDVFKNQVGRIYKKRLEDFLVEETLSRPCYLVKYDPFLNNRFFLEEIRRGLFRIEAKDKPGFYQGLIPDVTFPGSFRYKERLDLFGLDMDKEVLEGDLFNVRIFWSVAKSIDDNYIALLRFKRDKELKEHELEENSFIGIYTLGCGMLRPESLITGMVIADDFDCYVPPDTREGEYRVSLAFVEEEMFYSVPKEDLLIDYLDLGTVKVRENPEFEHYWD
jgi:hypothetical protein